MEEGYTLNNFPWKWVQNEYLRVISLLMVIEQGIEKKSGAIYPPIVFMPLQLSTGFHEHHRPFLNFNVFRVGGKIVEIDRNQ